MLKYEKSKWYVSTYFPPSVWTNVNEETKNWLKLCLETYEKMSWELINNYYWKVFNNNKKEASGRVNHMLLFGRWNRERGREIGKCKWWYLRLKIWMYTGSLGPVTRKRKGQPWVPIVLWDTWQQWWNSKVLGMIPCMKPPVNYRRVREVGESRTPNNKPTRGW